MIVNLFVFMWVALSRVSDITLEYLYLCELLVSTYRQTCLGAGLSFAAPESMYGEICKQRRFIVRTESSHCGARRPHFIDRVGDH